MQNFSFQDWGWILTISGWAVAGIFVIIGFFGQGNKTRKEESDKLADGLINRLQQTVEQQTKDIFKMQQDMVENTKNRDEEIRKLSDDLKHMQGRNAVLEDLFKGRDPAMQVFLKDAPHLFEITEQNNNFAKVTHDAITELAKAMKDLVERIDGNHLSVT